VAPIKEAILAIQAAEKLLSSAGAPEEVFDSTDTGLSSDEASWRPVLDLADAASLGLAGTLQDDEEALRLYKQAAKLGSAEACLRAAQIHIRNAELRDTRQALVYLKDGARRGLGDCHAEMAKIFAEEGHMANWKMCWSNYFASDAFCRGGSISASRAYYVLDYIREARQLRLPLDHRASIMEIKEEVLSFVEQRMVLFKESGTPTFLFEIQRYYIRQAVGENGKTESLHGQVQWFNRENGSGFINLDRGDRAFFTHDEVRTLEPFTQDHAEGLSVHCRVIQGPQGLIAFDVRVP
jgi:cold shock CspA family protein